MYILREGRKDFLDFLRNLTPQILILSLVIMCGVQLDFTVIDFSKTGLTFIFWVLVALWGMAFWANATLLVESAINSKRNLIRATAFLERRFQGWLLTIAKLKLLYRKDRGIFLESLVIAILIQFALVIVCFFGANHAARFVN
ncbi:hypothetical protein ACJJID_08650 [Microbulbifer sp. CnH-101-G]|uniref:hypothetical protein n=1 Tax=Microbulbifer sp. CnH-101-G TaxID=3243393 RepID=UPI00403A2101